MGAPILNTIVEFNNVWTDEEGEMEEHMASCHLDSGERIE